MKQEFIDYELNLEMFIAYGADAHARHLVGEPIKPEGYDEYQAAKEKLWLKNEKKETKNQKKEKITETYEVKGYEFDTDGIPKYLTADDVYNGIVNPEWLKKHEKVVLKPATRKISENKPTQNEKLGINYDEDGIPEYLDAECRHFGEVNPEWLKKHEPHNYKP